MFENASFGQYIAGNSFIHRLDPRIKFLSLFVFLVAVIMIRHPLAIILMAGLVIVNLFLSKINFHEAMGSIRPLIPLLIIAFILNLLVPREGDRILFEFAFLRISVESISNAISMTLRIFTLILSSNIFLSLTTSAMHLSSAVTSLIKPLGKVGVPVQDIGMMMSIALRFIPTLMAETDTLMKAQSSRGANYDSGGFIQRIKGFVSVLVPLFISSFRKAEALAEAMEARAYRSDIKRGKLNPLVLKTSDIIYFIGFTIACIAIVLFERLVLR